MNFVCAGTCPTDSLRSLASLRSLPGVSICMLKDIYIYIFFNLTICYYMLVYVIICYDMLLYVIIGSYMLLYVITCYYMLLYVTVCYYMFLYVMIYVIICYYIFLYVIWYLFCVFNQNWVHVKVKNRHFGPQKPIDFLRKNTSFGGVDLTSILGPLKVQKPLKN